jgi:acetylornithine deacetylase/succinyl-diaminopimelate desuccinylase-like protein
VSAAPGRPLAYARANRARFVRELQEFVRFPSVSAQPVHAKDVAACAGWLAAHLRGIGLRVVPVATKGHPVVFAEWGHRGDRPTVLVYGHYDVQPPDPVGAWRSPPFDPVVSDGYLHGRGSCDDKGQLFAHVKAIESYLQGNGDVPVNVRCVFEGEEEIGSPNLAAFMDEHAERLRADAAVVSDMRMLGRGRPALTYSLRGALSFDIEITGPAGDLHSGNFGGAVHNPLEALCRMIATLHRADGSVAVPGFYDEVRAWPAGERSAMARAGPSDAQMQQDAAAPAWGEPGFSLYERTTIRPCIVVNGITGGYQGPGAKAVIPSRATAKLNARLVPGQRPAAVERLIRDHVQRVTPPTVRASMRTLLRAEPVVIPRRHSVLRVAAMAYRRGFGADPAFVRSGGTIPIVNTLQDGFGIPTALMGFGLPDDRIHAPNERFLLANFEAGTRTSIWALAGFAGMRTAPAETTR